jgi:hypothetical protein
MHGAPRYLAALAYWLTMPENYDFDAAIMERDRVCHIALFYLSDSQFNSHAAPPLPDGFLGGSFPHLQFLALH